MKIQINNPPAGIRPGFSASADIITGLRPKAVAIPLQALVVREKPAPEGDKKKAPAPAPGKAQEEEGVYVFNDGKAQFAPVKTGLAGDSNIEVVSGLKPGQQIITGPFRALRDIKDGSKVKEQKEEQKKDEKA